MVAHLLMLVQKEITSVLLPNETDDKVSKQQMPEVSSYFTKLDLQPFLAIQLLPYDFCQMIVISKTQEHGRQYTLF